MIKLIVVVVVVVGYIHHRQDLLLWYLVIWRKRNRSLPGNCKGGEEDPILYLFLLPFEPASRRTSGKPGCLRGKADVFEISSEAEPRGRSVDADPGN